MAERGGDTTTETAAPATRTVAEATGAAQAAEAEARGTTSRWARWWRAGRDAGGRACWRRGRVPAVLAVLAAPPLAFHRLVPNSPGHLGSLLETFLPWSGLLIVVLFGLALLRRSALALVALVLPVAAWTYLFGGLLTGAESGAHDLVVVQHNVSDENADPAGTARALADAGPDLIGMEELLPAAVPVYDSTLAPRYPYHAVAGTVGLWSKHPLTGVRKLDVKPAGITEPWSRGLRAVVRVHGRPIAVYVAHLPSVRVHASGLASALRDESADLLGEEVAAEKLRAVILLGDLNSTVDDRGLAPLTTRLNVPSHGFALSFPASFPLARIDQVMARSATVDRVRTLPPTGSDHLPLIAPVTLD